MRILELIERGLEGAVPVGQRGVFDLETGVFKVAGGGKNPGGFGLGGTVFEDVGVGDGFWIASPKVSGLQAEGAAGDLEKPFGVFFGDGSVRALLVILKGAAEGLLEGDARVFFPAANEEEEGSQSCGAEESNLGIAEPRALVEGN